MMNTAFRRETVNAVYLALQTTKLSDLLKLVHEIPIQGVSITMPLKQEILPHLEQTDPLSAKIGAVNTIRLLDGKLYGFNTDVAGIILPAGKAPVPPRRQGPRPRRRRSRPRRRLRPARQGRRGLHPQPHPGDRAETRPPVRLQDHQEGSPRQDPLRRHHQRHARRHGRQQGRRSILEAKDLNTKLVFDLVYNPLETPLIRLARQQGINFITGIEMFVQQGARQFEIFTGKPAPEEEMFRVVLHALRQQAETAAAATVEAPAKPAKAQAAAAPRSAPAKAAATKTAKKAARK